MALRAPSARQLSAATAFAYRSIVLDIPVWCPQAPGGEAAAERVPGASAVNAVHLKCGGADLAPARSCQTALRSKRDAHQRRVELACHRFERAAGLFVAGQLRSEMPARR